VRLVVREGERGLSGAVLHGWQCSGAGILGVMDADLQHPPEMLPSLLAAIYQGNDLVVGSRYAQGGKVDRWNPVRRFLSAAAIWATWPLQQRHLRVCDPMSGFFLVRRECLNGILFQKVGFKLLLEILVRGRLWSIREIPFSFGLRHSGQSKASMKVVLHHAVLLLRLYRERFVFERRSHRTAATES
jgi:dolichol-phosphate mannosyltransferase